MDKAVIVPLIQNLDRNYTVARCLSALSDVDMYLFPHIDLPRGETLEETRTHIIGEVGHTISRQDCFFLGESFVGETNYQAWQVTLPTDFLSYNDWGEPIIKGGCHLLHEAEVLRKDEFMTAHMPSMWAYGLHVHKQLLDQQDKPVAEVLWSPN